VNIAPLRPTGRLDTSPAAAAPLARFESGVAVVAGRMYILGGHTEPDLVATEKVYRYDVAADRWDRRADVPVAISHVTAAVVENRYIWLVGGFVGQHPGEGIRESHRYDTVDDRWEQGPPLPEARASGGLVTHDGRLHYFGGLDADRHTNHADHWILDSAVATGWERVAPVPVGRTHAAATVSAGQIYAIGGHFGHDVPGQPGRIAAEPDLDVVHRYDPAADAWEEVAPLPYRRSHCEPSTVVHEGRIYCVGGRSNSPLGVCLREDRPLAVRLARIVRKVARRASRRKTSGGVEDIICYDPGEDRWSVVGSVGQELYAPAASVVDGELIVTNGGRQLWRDPSDVTMRIDLSTM